jgi:hypothetical protein
VVVARELQDSLIGYAVPVLARSARVRVVATGDGRLIVGNAFSTLTVPREHIGPVEIDDDGRSGPDWAIFVRRHEDLRFRLDVMHVPLRLSQDGRLQREAEALRSWRDGRPRHSADPTRHALARSTDLYGSG